MRVKKQLERGKAKGRCVLMDGAIILRISHSTAAARAPDRHTQRERRRGTPRQRWARQNPVIANGEKGTEKPAASKDIQQLRAGLVKDA